MLALLIIAICVVAIGLGWYLHLIQRKEKKKRIKERVKEIRQAALQWSDEHGHRPPDSLAIFFKDPACMLNPFCPGKYLIIVDNTAGYYDGRSPYPGEIRFRFFREPNPHNFSLYDSCIEVVGYDDRGRELLSLRSTWTFSKASAATSPKTA